MPRYFSFVVLLLLAGCKVNRHVNSGSHPQQQEAQEKTFRLSLTANDLSEDNRISTHNDEIVLLVYRESVSDSIPYLLLSQYAAFDSTGATLLADVNCPYSPTDRLTFFLIELDTDKDKEQVEPVVRINYRKIKTAYEQRDAQTLEKYFGDDDLLGIKSMPADDAFKKNTVLTFADQHLFDAWNYTLSFSEKKL